MNRISRPAITVFVGVAAVGIYFYGRTVLAELSGNDSATLLVELQWLLGLLALYPVNFAVAARFRNSFSITAARMLFFAVAAFLVLSHAVDILGEHGDMLGSIIGLTDIRQPQLIEPIRARLAAMAAMLTMCLVCIAVPFESASKVETEK